MNLFSKVVAGAFMCSSVFAGTLMIPNNIRVGANYVWHLSHANSQRDILKFNAARIATTPTALDQLNEANRRLRALSSSLEPTVSVVHQIPYSIDIGEQKVIYRVYSRTSGSAFYEVHILGKEQVPTIAGVRELDPNQVINLLAKPNIIDIPQK